MNFVVDTWVLFEAKERNSDAVSFLFVISSNDHKIFVDKDGQILKEYKGVNDIFVYRWLTAVISRGIIKVKIRKKCKNILNHRKDMKFVYVYLSCRRVKTIVSEDYHFTKNRDKLLKKGITLLGLTDALVLSKKRS